MSLKLISKLDPTQIKLLDEECIVVDKDDNQIRPQSKKECHLLININCGLIHRAFSVLLFNSLGELLLTQRSDNKITFPSFIGNSCCSHPLYNEMEREEMDAIGVKRAAYRRLQLELGINGSDITLNDIKYITRFIYKSAFNEVWGEYEIDYILVIVKDVRINPDHNEVKFYKYVSKQALYPFLKNQSTNNNPIGPWFKAIIENFLFNIWDNLDNLNNVQDHKRIHCIN